MSSRTDGRAGDARTFDERERQDVERLISIADMLRDLGRFERSWNDLTAILAAAFNAQFVQLRIGKNESETNDYLFESGVTRGPLVGSAPLPPRRSGSIASCALRIGPEAVGSILLERGLPFEVAETRLLESCAAMLATRVYAEDAAERGAHLERLAFTDGLTGIANRRRFDEVLPREWKRAQRTELPISLLMIDIDYFKRYNDAYGHQAGDRCLRAVAAAMQERIARPSDLLARYGGEEFVVVLPETTLAGATRVGEELRHAVAGAAIVYEDSSLGMVSLSIGAAVAVPSPSEDCATLLAAADRSLYRAKQLGRNRLCADGYESRSVTVERRGRVDLSSLPEIEGALIGRAHELREIDRLLDRRRILTLIGTGGTGKTRVAIAAAHERKKRYADGAHFIDLAPISDGRLLAPAVGELFELRIAAGEEGPSQLAGAIGDRHALLVFDNCEQAIAMVSEVVAAIYAQCPNVQILATSRAPLEIDDQAIYRIPSLAVPGTNDVTPEESLRYGAVELFYERAKAARGNFSFDERNVGAVIDICRLLDGIALAIELIAARVSVSEPVELLARLHEDFSLLAAGRRSNVERHQTMQASIDWSYRMLGEREAALFRSLAVFVGGWTLEAAARICQSSEMSPQDIFDLHGSLLDLSMITESGERGRFRMLEPMLEFARVKLRASGEERRLSATHAEYFAHLARRSDESFYTTNSQQWFSGIAPEIGNYRSALVWSLENSENVKLGCAIVGALMWYFYYTLPNEGVEWARLALTELRARAADPALEARIQLGLAPLYLLRPDERLAAARRAVELYRSIGDSRRLAHALRLLTLTLAWYYEDCIEEARRCIEEAHAIAETSGDAISVALVLQAKSQVLPHSDLLGRRALQEKALAILREVGNDRQLSVALIDLAESTFAAGEGEKNMAYGSEALAFARSSGSKSTIMTAASNLAHYAAAHGNTERAEESAHLVLQLAHETHSAEFITYAWNARAAIAAKRGCLHASACILGFCDARFGTLHTPRHEGMSEEIVYRQTRALLEAALPKRDLDELTASGVSMDERELERLIRDSC